jgi:hypothetical protein
VPEAPVDEDREAACREDDVGSPSHTRRDWSVDPKPQPTLVQQTTKR